jgi:stage II sporulation protein D
MQMGISIRKLLGILVILFLSENVLANQDIRVLLDEGLKTLDLVTSYPIQATVPGAKNPTESMQLNHGRSTLQIRRELDQWTVEVTTRGKKQEQHLSGAKLRLQSRLLGWNKQAIDFPVEVVATRNGLLLIGIMPMNRYLQGVVPHEMPPTWPLEALKAQSVASRTYAMWKMKNGVHINFDIRPSILDQVFRLDRYGSSHRVHPNVVKALQQTEGMYIGGARTSAIKAYFHSDCGGGTDSAEAIWGDGQRTTTSVQDLACSKRKSEWSSKWPLERLKQKIMSTYFLPADLELQDVIVRNQLKSARVEFVDLMFSKGIFKRVRGEDLRRLLGYEKIKSTRFQVNKSGSSWVFSGRGFGHGVGMCQWGARSMAQSGKSFKKILAHYYPNTRLKEPTNVPEVISSESLHSVSAL